MELSAKTNPGLPYVEVIRRGQGGPVSKSCLIEREYGCDACRHHDKHDVNASSGCRHCESKKKNQHTSRPARPRRGPLYFEIQQAFLKVSGDSQERQAFRFFEVKTATELISLSNDEFWHSTILQMSHDYECIRHAIVAMGTIHQQVFSRDQQHSSKGSGNRFAIQQYNLAISTLRSMIANNSCPPEVAMICSVLFACFESAQGGSAKDMGMHIKNGINLVSAWKNGAFGSRTASEHEVAQDTITHLIRIGLYTEDTEIHDGNETADMLAALARMKSAYIPVEFQSVVEARDHFATVHVWVKYYLSQFRRQDMTQQPDAPQRQQLLQLLTFVTEQLKAFEATLRRFSHTFTKALSENETKALQWLWIRYSHVAAVVSTSRIAEIPTPENPQEATTPGASQGISSLYNDKVSAVLDQLEVFHIGQKQTHTSLQAQFESHSHLECIATPFCYHFTLTWDFLSNETSVSSWQNRSELWPFLLMMDILAAVQDAARLMYQRASAIRNTV